MLRGPAGSGSDPGNQTGVLDTGEDSWWSEGLPADPLSGFRPFDGFDSIVGLVAGTSRDLRHYRLPAAFATVMAGGVGGRGERSDEDNERR